MNTSNLMARIVVLTSLSVGVLPPAWADSPSNLSDWIAESEPGIGSYEILSTEYVPLPFIGQDLIRVKAFDFERNEPCSYTFDEDGVQIAEDGLALRMENYQRRRDLYGALDDGLWALAISTDAQTPIPVMIWLKTYEPNPDKEGGLEDPFLAQLVEESHQRSRDSAFDQLRSVWKDITRSTLRYSTRVPAAYSELTPDELFSLADQDAVAAIYLDEPPRPSASTYVSTVSANLWSYDGLNRRVCIIEPDPLPSPNGLTIVGTYCGTGSAGWHGRWVAGIIRSSVSPFGTATLTDDYFANWGSCDANGAPAEQYCADQGADVWNFSHTCGSGPDRLFDYHVKASPYPLISAASGNQDDGTSGTCPTSCTNGRATVDCAFFNGLVVGGTNECGDSTRSNDKIWCTAEDSNVGNRELPNLVAPAKDIDAEGTTASGTSAAAPQVAGAAAQISEVDGSLDGWPEASRAIIMAGADEDVDNGRLSLSDGVDDRDGAGELNIGRSVTIAQHKVAPGSSPSQHGWFDGTIYQSSTPANNWYSSAYRSLHVVSSGRLRAVLAWDATATCTNPTLASYSCSADSLDADLDLYVFRDSDGALVASSTSVPNSYEFVEFDTVSGETYSIHIWVDAWTNTYTFYGIAWSQGTYSP